MVEDHNKAGVNNGSLKTAMYNISWYYISHAMVIYEISIKYQTSQEEAFTVVLLPIQYNSGLRSKMAAQRMHMDANGAE